MTEPTPLPGLAEVATESPEESVRREAEIVGNEPGEGGLVPEDDAQ